MENFEVRIKWTTRHCDIDLLLWCICWMMNAFLFSLFSHSFRVIEGTRADSQSSWSASPAQASGSPCRTVGTPHTSLVFRIESELLVSRKMWLSNKHDKGMSVRFELSDRTFEKVKPFLPQQKHCISVYCISRCWFASAPSVTAKNRCSLLLQLARVHFLSWWISNCVVGHSIQKLFNTTDLSMAFSMSPNWCNFNKQHPPSMSHVQVPNRMAAKIMEALN